MRESEKSGEKRGGRKRLVFAGALVAIAAAVAGAVVAVSLGTTGSNGPSWAPSVREIGGLRSVAVAPDGMTAAAGGDSTKIVLFDLDD